LKVLSFDGRIEKYEDGRFAWLSDPEGNRLGALLSCRVNTQVKVDVLPADMKYLTTQKLWSYRRMFWILVGLALGIWLLSIFFWRLIEVLLLTFS
jgi:hypothetical protein